MLTDIPPEGLKVGRWQPRILHCEAKNVTQSKQMEVEAEGKTVGQQVGAAGQVYHESHSLKSSFVAHAALTHTEGGQASLPKRAEALAEEQACQTAAGQAPSRRL